MDGSPENTAHTATRAAGMDSNSPAAVGTPTLAEPVTRRAEEASQLTEYSFRLAIERVVREGIVAWDLEGRQTYVGDVFCDLVGWKEEELVGATPPFLYWPKEAAGQMAAAFQRILEGDWPSDGLKLRFLRSDGEPLDVLVACTPLVADDGTTQGRLASVVEIT